MSKRPIKDIVKKQEWQNTREKLVGQWKEKPEWCCGVLKKYLGNITKSDYDDLRIVMNYLTGTGFRIGKIKHPCIQTLRINISMELKKRKALKRD